MQDLENTIRFNVFIAKRKGIIDEIPGTTAVRNLKQFESICELKRMYVLRDFRRLGLGQKMLDIAIDFAIRCQQLSWRSISTTKQEDIFQI